MKQQIKQQEYRRRILRDALLTIGLIVLATLLSTLLAESFVDSMDVVIVYFLMVVIVSRVTTGYWCGVVASLAGVIGVNFFFTYPYSALNFWIAGYPVTFSCMLLASLCTSALTSRIKEQTAQSKVRERQSEALYGIVRTLLCLREPEQIAQTAADSLSRQFECRAVIGLGNPDERRFFCSGEGEEQAEIAAMIDAFQNGHESGNGTPYCTDCAGFYLPISVEQQPIGVVGLLGEIDISSPQTLVFLRLIIAQIAIALEYRRLEKEHERAAFEAEAEKTRGNLLRAISHDLRTPLTGIYGASSTILRQGDRIERPLRDELLRDICENSQWLIRMVENLLTVTRIGQNASKVSKIPEAAEEIVGSAVANLRKNYPQAQIVVSAPQELLIVPMDAMLIQQVLINLADNAIKYAKSGEPIEVTVRIQGEMALFTVMDRGTGLPAERISAIFEGRDAHTQQGDSYRGMGIGLPICKTIITAHGGTIGAVNRKDGGCCFYFTLPMEQEEGNDEGSAQ